jgi:micrococcal nuclease
MSAQPAYTYDAWLTGLVDGDTLHCGVDLGCDVAINLTIRLYGINAPEMSTPEGKAAKEFAAQWFVQHSPDGKFVLETIKDRREKYGRYLGIVEALDGANLNNDMVSSGHAVAYFPKGIGPQ